MGGAKLGEHRRARPTVEPGEERRAWRHLVLGPILGAGVLSVLGHEGPAATIATVAAAFALVMAVRPGAAVRADRWLGVGARSVGAVLSTVVLAVVYGLVVLPAGLLIVVLGRTRLAPPDAPAAGWTQRSDQERPAATVPFARERFERAPQARPGVARWAVRLAGVVALLLVVDVAAGALLNATGLLPGPSGDLVSQLRSRAEATIDSPAMAGSPWIREYEDELYELNIVNRVRSDSFRGWVSPDVEGRYINVRDGERRSYQPEVTTSDGRPLEIAFFGGSALFGDGQRDEHTIPSEVARLAESAGVPVRVHNFGVLGYVSWQELLAYESEAAQGRHIDLVVFYDGFNDLSVQADSYSTDPVSGSSRVLQAFRDTFVRDHATEPGATDGLSALRRAYARASGAVRVWDHLVGDSAPFAADYAVRGTEHQVVAATLGIYARAQALARSVALDHGSQVRFVWQPRRDPWPAGLIEGLPPSTVDLTGALDGRADVYSDAVHTNERGAAIVARALWNEIEPDLRALIVSGGREPGA